MPANQDRSSPRWHRRPGPARRHVGDGGPPSAQTCLPRSRAAAAHPAPRRTAGGRPRCASGSCTWRPGPTPTFTMSAPASMSSSVPAAVTTLPATMGTAVADRGERLQHLVLVAVGGVDDDHVDPGRDQGLRSQGDIAVDTRRQRRSAACRTRRRRAVQRRSQCARCAS